MIGRVLQMNQLGAVESDVRPTAGYLQLLKYELPLGPALFIDLDWFPASHFTTGPAEWIGLTGGFVVTRTPNNRILAGWRDTSVSRLLEVRGTTSVDDLAIG